VELRIDDGSVHFLRLLADVAALAGVDLAVPRQMGTRRATGRPRSVTSIVSPCRTRSMT
jgi:hypothetical protein